MKRFLKNPGACARPGNPVISDLIYGWGNETWSAQEEYLAGCIDQALNTSGPILECGSGLSTILVGAVAKRRGQCHLALEHTPDWAAKMRSYLARYKLDSKILQPKPLKDYGDFAWYDAPLESMPCGFSLVICDGPPGGTKGGRYGLLPIMKEHLRPDCVVLLDDAGRDDELAIARRWAAEIGAAFRIHQYQEALHRDEDDATAATSGRSGIIAGRRPATTLVRPRRCRPAILLVKPVVLRYSEGARGAPVAPAAPGREALSFASDDSSHHLSS